MRPLRSVSKSSKPLFAQCLAIALIAGCGGPGQNNVSGKLTVDGAPAVGAVLLFHPIENKDAPLTRIGLCIVSTQADIYITDSIRCLCADSVNDSNNPAGN